MALMWLSGRFDCRLPGGESAGANVVISRACADVVEGERGRCKGTLNAQNDKWTPADTEWCSSPSDWASQAVQVLAVSTMVSSR